MGQPSLTLTLPLRYRRLAEQVARLERGVSNRITSKDSGVPRFGAALLEVKEQDSLCAEAPQEKEGVICPKEREKREEWRRKMAGDGIGSGQRAPVRSV